MDRLWMRPMRTTLTTALLAATVALGSACDAAPDRAALVCDTLFVDNAALAARDPSLVDEKLTVMGADRYDWFRGTLRLFLRDATLPGAPWSWTPRSAKATGIALVGDPHVENVSTYLDASGAVRLEFNDFDAATWGPWWLDAWRLATSLALLDNAGLAAADPVLARRLAETVARAYVAEVGRSDASAPGRIVDDGRQGRLIGQLFSKARNDAADQEIFADWTRLGDAGRLLVTDAAASDDYLAAAGTIEAALVGGAWDRARPRGTGVEPAGPLLDLARRYGAGVASRPNLRYYLLLDGGTDQPLDDLIIEAKETLDAPPALDPTLRNRSVATDDAARAVALQRALQGELAGLPSVDPWLSASAGTPAFRFRGVTSWQRSPRHEDLEGTAALGAIGAAPMIELANTLGRLLALSHLRAPTRDGAAAAPILATDLAGREDAFISGLGTAAVEMAVRIDADWRAWNEGGARSCHLTEPR
jgi:uncharacterized protein (DUF2252 family)